MQPKDPCAFHVSLYPKQNLPLKEPTRLSVKLPKKHKRFTLLASMPWMTSPCLDTLSFFATDFYLFAFFPQTHIRFKTIGRKFPFLNRPLYRTAWFIGMRTIAKTTLLSQIFNIGKRCSYAFISIPQSRPRTPGISITLPP